MSENNKISRRKFIYGAGCMCGVSIILPSCTQVAMSDRQQFNILSDDFLYSKTFPAYNNFKNQTKPCAKKEKSWEKNRFSHFSGLFFDFGRLWRRRSA